MNEVASIHARGLIETLLHVHALTNMHRATENDDHRKTAAAWLPTLESQFAALREALTSKRAKATS